MIPSIVQIPLYQILYIQLTIAVANFIHRISCLIFASLIVKLN